MKINASELWPKNFNEVARSVFKHEFTEIVMAGGRGSTKSTTTSLLIIITLMQNPEYNALVVRKVSNTLRDSVYNQLKWAVQKLGVENLFNFTLTPLQATYKPTGQTIYFRGADDPLKIKSIKATNGYIAITWFEEVAEFSYNDIETIKLSTMRGGDSYYNFFTYNPPSSTRAWVNTEFRKPRADRLFHESNYTTVPAEWLGDAFLFEAEEMKKNNERAYRNIFLGEPTGTGSNVFENIEIREITDEEINHFEWVYSAIDFGYYPDAFRFIVFSYDMKTKTIYLYYELSLLKHGNYEASEKMKEFCDKNNIDRNIRIVGDSANPKDIADMRQFGWNCRGAIKGRGSLEAGFKWLQSRTKIVIDPVRCPYGADEFSLFEFERDKKTGEVIKAYDINQPDHTIAAMRYGTEEIWRQGGN